MEKGERGEMGWEGCDGVEGAREEAVVEGQGKMWCKAMVGGGKAKGGVWSRKYLPKPKTQYIPQ